ncbi:hypothetical protein C8Q70DRAFT_998549 [Cubamyces menziesii]|nr:hypothetical protein C8Q70DRAFT_998549 [Cubamyces menziesii]
MLDLVSVLERSRHSSSLRSLDLRAGIHRHDPSLSRPQPQVPSFAPQLTHFGIEILCQFGADEMTVTPLSHVNMLRLLSDLPRCRALRSLSLQFDCSMALLLRSMGKPVAPVPLAVSRVFIDALSDVLSTPGGPAFPALERLSLIFLTPLGWLSACGPAFKRLAHACLARDDSGKRRYSRISDLNIHQAVKHTRYNAESDIARIQFIQDREKILLPMLASFVQGGIAVEVTLE